MFIEFLSNTKMIYELSKEEQERLKERKKRITSILEALEEVENSLSGCGEVVVIIQDRTIIQVDYKAKRRFSD